MSEQIRQQESTPSALAPIPQDLTPETLYQMLVQQQKELNQLKLINSALLTLSSAKDLLVDAASKGNLALVCAFIDMGIEDVNHEKDSNTALLGATRHGHSLSRNHILSCRGTHTSWPMQTCPPP